MTEREPEPTPAHAAGGEPIAPPPPSMGGATTAWASTRPLPVLSSLAGAAAGLLFVASLVLFLGELGPSRRRLGGIAISLAFEVIGVLLLRSNRNRRTATSGVVVTAIGIIPLLVYLFVDVKDPSRTIDSVAGFTRTATWILLAAAALWLAAYLFGPGRRYGFYLGAALVALWLVSVVQIVDRPLGQLADGFGPFGSSSTSFTTVGPRIDSGGSADFDSSDFGDSDLGNSGFGGYDPNPRVRTTENHPEPPDNPSTKLGIASLLFGGAYLAVAARRDRAGDGRTATVFFAVSVPILTIAVLFLAHPLHTVGASLLGLAISVVAVAVAAPLGRRFTSWYGTGAAVVAVLALVADALGESDRAMAAVLALVGVAVALLGSRLPRDGDEDGDRSISQPWPAHGHEAAPRRTWPG